MIVDPVAYVGKRAMTKLLHEYLTAPEGATIVSGVGFIEETGDQALMIFLRIKTQVCVSPEDARWLADCLVDTDTMPAIVRKHEEALADFAVMLGQLADEADALKRSRLH